MVGLLVVARCGQVFFGLFDEFLSLKKKKNTNRIKNEMSKEGNDMTTLTCRRPIWTLTCIQANLTPNWTKA